LLPNRQFCKIDTDALLRMDPHTRAEVTAAKISSRVLAPSEARLIDDRPPYTDAQLAEFERFWPTKSIPAQASEPKVPTTPFTFPPEPAHAKNGSGVLTDDK
jgi:hypothetical protein